MLNRQFTGARGTLTVEALRIRMLLDHRQKLVLGHLGVCHGRPGGRRRPERPALRLTLGGLGLLVLGGIAYLLTRRRRKLAARRDPSLSLSRRQAGSAQARQRSASAQGGVDRIARRQPADGGGHEVLRGQLRRQAAEMHQDQSVIAGPGLDRGVLLGQREPARS